MNSATALSSLELKSRSSVSAFFKSEGLALLTCCLVCLLCMALVYPEAGSGFIDSWSYADVAYRLAQTGRLYYSGWGSPSVVFQSVWAVPWIRLFGFSFDLLRLITLPFSLAFVALTYLLGRRVGLRKEFALFAALIMATSPLYLSHACSFMTEPYACTFTVAGIYAAIDSADAATPRRAKLWLWALVVASILGGSDRQSVWVMPLSLIPYLWWKRRQDRGFQTHALLALAASLLAMVVVIKYCMPAYAPTSLTRTQMLSLLFQHSFTVFHRIVSVFMVAFFLALPAFFAAPKLLKRFTARQLALLALICIPVLLIVRIGKIGLMPFIGTILSNYGLFPIGAGGLGFKPMLLTMPVRNLLTYLFLVVVAIWSIAVSRKYLEFKLSRTAGMVFLISTCAYLPLLIPGAMAGFIYDRYCLPLLPLLLIWVLFSMQSVTARVALPAYLCLLIFAGYAVVTTHDYFSELRARALAGQQLERRGVPADRMSIGFEFDGWTQVRTAGHVGTLMYNDDLTKEKFWFWIYGRNLKHEFVAMAEPLPDPVRNEILHVPFTAWTSPCRRKISIVKEADVPFSALDFDVEH